jgi:GNAT superfamily N-acetyltransferase
MKISYLSDFTDFLPIIAEWHAKQWPDCFKRGNLVTAIQELKRSLNRDCLPITLVATENNELLGSISLVVRDLPIRPDLEPWLTTLFVNPVYRGHGVSKALLDEGILCLRSLGKSRAYVWLEKNVAVYQKWGWQLTETIRYENKYAFVMKGDLRRLTDGIGDKSNY